MAVWACGIYNIKDAKRVIKEEKLRFPISVAEACNCNEITLLNNATDFKEIVEIAIACSPTKEIAFLVP